MNEVTLCHAEQWASAEFAHVELGDKRRTTRLVEMAAACCERPSGKVAAVFTTDPDREGAYDFVENRHVDVTEMVAGLGIATARRCEGLPFVYVPVDGTSITVTDWSEQSFGRIGTDANGARGLKVIDALAVDPKGTPVGLLGLTWWSRQKRAPKQSHARQSRPLEQKETRYWVQTVRAACSCLDEHQVRGWFQIDREGDGRDLLLALHSTKHWWTVRANADRSIELQDGDTGKLRAELARKGKLDLYTLAVVGKPGRRERNARMVVRVAQVVLRLRDKKTKRITLQPVTTVWAHEEGTTPRGETPLDWLLHTNHPVESFADAKAVIDGYAQRWRVEEFHRTWKRGDCDVESTQLGSPAAVERWATILASSAVRIERLKGLARHEPNVAASVELSPSELRALKVLKFGADAPERDLTIAEAVLWLAELGGYANKYSKKSKKEPGATVLGRGLRYLAPAARLLEIQRA